MEGERRSWSRRKTKQTRNSELRSQGCVASPSWVVGLPAESATVLAGRSEVCVWALEPRADGVGAESSVANVRPGQDPGLSLSGAAEQASWKGGPMSHPEGSQGARTSAVQTALRAPVPSRHQAA